MIKQYLPLLCLLFLINTQAQTVYPFKQSFAIESNEKWFGGAVNEGWKMPFSNGYSLDLYGNNEGNQAGPYLVSTSGRFIRSNQPFQFSITNNRLTVNSIEEIKVEKGGSGLSDAFRSLSKKAFPASGKMPDTLLFSRPQYNTWIELIYNQNQQDILKYAHAIIDNGFPAGVLMIDDNWAPYYGRFEFRKDRFPDAKAMIDELHRLGFKVMIWVCPFIRPDSEEFRLLLKQKLLLFDNKGNNSLSWKDAKEPALIHWWNGYSAEMDFTNPAARQWYEDQLHYMQTTYGADGFKLDAGDMEYYPAATVSFKKATPNEQCEAWGAIGLKFPLNEYRAMWKKAGEPLVERLRDKAHSWQDLQRLIPNVTAAGLLGYQFTCPDMIGGGEFTSFIDNAKLDQDLVVRSAQIHALMPMMQFSAAPWRVLDQQHLHAVKKAVDLRMKFGPYIMQLVHECAVSGEPMARTLEYVFPHQGLENISDQFMLGAKILVAPVVEKNANRKVLFPPGKWKSADGKTINGPTTKEYDVLIDQLLWFEWIGK